MVQRSTLLLFVPEAEPAVGALRLAHDPAARAGLGAHVTLLFPFIPAARIDDALVEKLRNQFAGSAGLRGAVQLRFDRLARFPSTSYLALADPAAVVAKVRALTALWPEYPPYGGAFPDIVPHLTVAHGEESVLAAAEAQVAPALPILSQAQFASLAVEDATGRWHERARFGLG